MIGIVALGSAVPSNFVPREVIHGKNNINTTNNGCFNSKTVYVRIYILKNCSYQGEFLS